jgi:ligand-binding sensor domain-containing protein
VFVANWARGLYVSDDNGESWRQINFEIGETKPIINCVAIDSKGQLFVGTNFEGIFTSTNNGDSWNKISSLDANSIYIDENDDIYAVLWWGGIYRSTDSGTSWTQIMSGIRLRAIALNSKSELFVATWGDGVFRSKDGGNSWEQVNSGLTNLHLQSIAINSNDEILVGTVDYIRAGGVFLSDNNGESWDEINSGLANTFVHALSLDPNGYIFAGTYGGVFRSMTSTTSVERIEEGLPGSFSLLQNYPNPFNPSTTISYYLDRNTKVVLKVHNLIGQEIITLVDEYQRAGLNSIFWNGKNNLGQNITSGIYIYKLQAGKYIHSKKMLLMK